MVDDPVQLFKLSIDEITQSHLLSIAKWNRFLSITGMVLSFLSVAALLVNYNNFFTQRHGPYHDISYYEDLAGLILSIVFILLYFIPCFFRLSSSGKMIKAINDNDQQLLNDSMGQLKTYSKYWGILTIVLISLSIIMIGLSFVSE